MPDAAPVLSAALPALSPTMNIFAVRAVRAFRLIALTQTVDVDAQPRLIELLGHHQAANAFRLLLTAMSAAWPEPLAVFHPCARRLTHDEIAFVSMLHHARTHDRPAFDRQLADLIAPDARSLLYTASRRFCAAANVV